MKNETIAPVTKETSTDLHPEDVAVVESPSETRSSPVENKDPYWSNYQEFLVNL